LRPTVAVFALSRLKPTEKMPAKDNARAEQAQAGAKLSSDWPNSPSETRIQKVDLPAP
jgi:hypothetical protein